MQRFQSRTPRGGAGGAGGLTTGANGLATPAIEALVFSREQARLAKDFAAADSFRAQLQSAGVSVLDKTSTWTAVDGRSGRIPTFTEVELRQGGPPGRDVAQGSQRGRSAGPAGHTKADIDYLVVLREQARREKDFALADAIRDRLAGAGVTLDDRTSTWQTSGGMSGRIPAAATTADVGRLADRAAAALVAPAAGGHGGHRGGYGGGQAMPPPPPRMPAYAASGMVDIEGLVSMREQARLAKDWPAADHFREQLRAAGVIVSDKERAWTAADGRSGPIPSFAEVEAHVMAPPMRGGPPTVSLTTGDVESLVFLREEARLTKQWELADALREKLAGAGITLLDKENRWSASDGRGGRVPNFKEIEARKAAADLGVGAIAPVSHHAPHNAYPHGAFPPPPPGAGLNAATPTEEIVRLVVLREEARLRKDWSQADALRQQISAAGVSLQDKEHCWQATDGRSGRIPSFAEIEGQGACGGPPGPGAGGFPGEAFPPPPAPQPPNGAFGGSAWDLDVDGLVFERERARLSKDWARADSLRNELVGRGVTLNDKASSWTATDGRSGRIPSFSEVEAASLPPQMMPPPMDGGFIGVGVGPW